MVNSHILSRQMVLSEILQKGEVKEMFAEVRGVRQKTLFTGSPKQQINVHFRSKKAYKSRVEARSSSEGLT
jgi:hypothetical protein